MDKTITIGPLPDDLIGREWIVPVLVDWFPPLTESQMLENAAAHTYGREAPHPDANMIEVRVRRGT